MNMVCNIWITVRTWNGCVLYILYFYDMSHHNVTMTQFWIHACKYVCERVCVCGGEACTYVRTYVCTYVYVCMYVRARACV
jgi:hypothetical protein